MEESVVQAQIQYLRSLNPQTHWLCPRINNEDATQVGDFDTITPKEDGGRTHNSIILKFENATRRRDAVKAGLLVFSFQGGPADNLKAEFGHGIKLQLERCDQCIHLYYRLKHGLVQQMMRDYAEEEAAEFQRILDTVDLERIQENLHKLQNALERLPSDKRKISNLPPSLLLTVLETLVCEASASNSGFLASSFDIPWKLCQANEPFKLEEYTPAHGHFLFSDNDTRSGWALESLASSTSLPQITPNVFEWAFRRPVDKAITKALTTHNGNEAYQLQFWEGMSALSKRLTRDTITHHLLALEYNIFSFGLQMVHANSKYVIEILTCFQSLIATSPADFWNAAQNFAPHMIIETILRAPAVLSFLEQAESKTSKSSPAQAATAWLHPFMSSLKPANTPEACRAIAKPFLVTFQTFKYPETARAFLLHEGLIAILNMLEVVFPVATDSRSSSASIVVSHALDVVEHHKDVIFDVACSCKSDQDEYIIPVAKSIIRKAFGLDCRRLIHQQSRFQPGSQPNVEKSVFQKSLWEYVLAKLPGNESHLLPPILASLAFANGLETVPISKEDSKKGVAQTLTIHNGTTLAFAKIQADIFLLVSELGAPDVRWIFEDTKSSLSMFGSLHSSIEPVFSSAVQVIKNATSEASRPEAIAQILKISYSATFKSVISALQTMRERGTFSSYSRLYKTSSDVFEALFSIEYGFLQQRNLTAEEKKALCKYWTSIWQALHTVFTKTIAWGTQYSKDEMRDFARETIEFAEKLFNYHHRFKEVLETEGNGEKEVRVSHQDATTKTLQDPISALDKMVIWLRLADDYLLSTMTRLICRIFNQLFEYGMQVHADCTTFVGQIVRGSKKSILTVAQRLELGQAIGVTEEINNVIDLTAEDSAVRTAQRSTSNGLSRSSTATERVAAKSRKSSNVQVVIDIKEWASKSKKNKTEQSIEDVYGTIDDEDLARAVALSEADAKKKTIPLVPFEPSKKPTTTHPGVKSIREKAREEEERKIKQDIIKAKDSEDFIKRRKQAAEEKRARDLAAVALQKKKASSSALTATAGSGIKGLTGFPNKDHTPKPSGLLVDSDSDTESSDDEVDGLLAVAGKLSSSKTSKAVEIIEASKRKAMLLTQQLPTKKIKETTSKPDIRARLMPDLRSLRSTILSWNYFHKGEFPPTATEAEFSHVPNVFESADHYKSTFERLHMLEAWQGLLKAKEELTAKPYELKILARATVDSFIELNTSMAQADGKEIAVGESDIVLISKGNAPTKDQSEPNCLARVSRIQRQKGNIEISYHVCHNGPLSRFLNPGIVLHAVKVASIVPLEREYGALIGLRFYDLRDEICAAVPSPLLPYSPQQLQTISRVYELNPAQAKAVKSSIDNDCFTLVQGPPGSGKTKTIVAIVGSLLSTSSTEKGSIISRPNQSNGTFGTSNPAKKLLVCAPSNAAVDELVLRFKKGVKTLRNEHKSLAVVRIGKSDTINKDVMDLTLDRLVDEKLNVGKKPNVGEDMNKLLAQHKEKTDIINGLRETLDSIRKEGRSSQDLQIQLEAEQKERRFIGNKLDSLRDASGAIKRDQEINRKRAQQSILEEADVICATLSGSGHDMFQNLSIEFETVVIDEAAQSVELSALIPLKYGCTKCILVGDPKQLPPTVLSREAARFQYEQSLFVRMQTNYPDRVHLLDTQYRMHPDISQYPSQAFYDSRLVDGPRLAISRSQPWHALEYLGPYRFFDVEGQQQSASTGHSMLNIAEINVAIQLFDRLSQSFTTKNFHGKIGIITPYKAQMHELRRRFKSRFGENVTDQIEFNSTDAFQGRECEIIILSCVRASGKGIGFVGDVRRMNVGLTRAKSSLWILGNSRALTQNEVWRGLIEDAKARSCYTSGDVIRKLQQSPGLQQGNLTAAQHMANPSKTDSDVKMDDAPPSLPPAPKAPYAASAKILSANVDVQMTNNVDAKPMLQAGGFNGLNKSQACTFCGALSHISALCDNVEAKRASGFKCHRCGSLSHLQGNCTAIICMRCGAMDSHSTQECENSKKLSVSERRRLETRESNISLEKSKSGEKRLAERGITNSVPKPKTTDQKEENRLNAPPPGAPKGPKINGPTNQTTTGDYSQKNDSFQDRKRPLESSEEGQSKRSRNATPEQGLQQQGGSGQKGNGAPAGGLPKQSGHGKVFRPKVNNDPFANARSRKRR